LGHVVERHWDHVRLLHDLPDVTTMAQEMVVSSVFSITEILTIEDHKLDNTFLYIAFGSQKLLKPTRDQIGSDTN
jgi:hypothetical protein